MEKNEQQPNENLMVAKFDPAVIYGGASKLTLSESEMKSLCAPFDDMDYEIRPDGYIYIPQAITLKRLNESVGIGRWGLLLINNGKDDLGNGQFKVFYDGCLVIRDCFVSRSVGEAQYSRNNKNQSWASAFESAKTDCRQRCCKDLGIANDAWNPSFIRRWQKEHAVKVFVDAEEYSTVTKTKEKIRKIHWRRKDIDPFWNEIGIVPDVQRPNVAQQPGSVSGKPVTDIWKKKVNAKNDLTALTALYNDNKAEVDGWKELKEFFYQRREQLKQPV